MVAAPPVLQNATARGTLLNEGEEATAMAILHIRNVPDDLYETASARARCRASLSVGGGHRPVRGRAAVMRTARRTSTRSWTGAQGHPRAPLAPVPLGYAADLVREEAWRYRAGQPEGCVLDASVGAGARSRASRLGESRRETSHSARYALDAGARVAVSPPSSIVNAPSGLVEGGAAARLTRWHESGRCDSSMILVLQISVDRKRLLGHHGPGRPPELALEHGHVRRTTPSTSRWLPRRVCRW